MVFSGKGKILLLVCLITEELLRSATSGGNYKLQSIGLMFTSWKKWKKKKQLLQQLALHVYAIAHMQSHTHIHTTMSE